MTLIAARNAARKAKNFKEADRIRDELAAMGIQLKDAKDPATGEIVTTWEVRASGATEVEAVRRRQNATYRSSRRGRFLDARGKAGRETGRACGTSVGQGAGRVAVGEAADRERR